MNYSISTKLSYANHKLFQSMSLRSFGSNNDNVNCALQGLTYFAKNIDKKKPEQKHNQLHFLSHSKTISSLLFIFISYDFLYLYIQRIYQIRIVFTFSFVIGCNLFVQLLEFFPRLKGCAFQEKIIVWQLQHFRFKDIILLIRSFIRKERCIGSI